MVVDLVAMAVTLGNRRRAVDAVRERARDDLAGLRAEPHGSTQIGTRIAALDRSVAVLPLGDQRDHRMRRIGLEFGAVRIREAGFMPGILDDGELHAEANAQTRNAVFARVAYRLDLALDPALPDPAGHEHGVDSLQHVDAVALDRLRIDVL